jgi:predicted CoA-binding protein
MTTLKQVEDFLGLKRVAVVGVSRDPKHFNTVMWEEFRQRRYDAIPVNPNATEIDGQKCYASVKEIDPPVEGVLIMTSRKDAEQVVRDCAEAGIKNVWLYGGMMPGAASQGAKALCEESGLNHVDGLCPYMFLPDTPAMHTPHRLWKKLTGSYPKRG